MSNPVTQIDLNPPTLEILTPELLPITVEWADLIGKTSTVTAPNGVIYDDSNGIPVPNGFLNSYGANGTQAQYIFQGQFLQKGHTYTAILSVNVGSQVYKQRLSVKVPR